jgi:putative transcriptional regulator
MSRKDTLIRAVKRGGKLYREMPDGSEVEMPIPPGRHMTAEEIHAAALRDPDNPPRSADQLARMKSKPRVFIMRRAMKLTQEEFAEQFQIPLGTLRDWEQGRVEPDQAAKAYLKVIAHNPALVLDALQAVLKRPPIATAADPEAAE